MWCLNSFVQDSVDLLLSEEERRMYDWSLLRKATHTVEYAWPYEADVTQRLADKTPLPVLELPLLHFLFLKLRIWLLWTLNIEMHQNSSTLMLFEPLINQIKVSRPKIDILSSPPTSLMILNLELVED